MKNKFIYYEIVNVTSDDIELNELKNKSGVVLGMVFGSDNQWHYSVQFDPPINGWDLPEYVLETTGKFSSRENIYDGSILNIDSAGQINDGFIKDE